MPEQPLEAISPIDWGPIYKETIYGRWPVEPWNTLTTLFFLLFVAYWTWKIRGNWQRHPLLVVTLPLIFVGFVGGFLYHSFRDNKIWLLMDWGPIMVTALICCIFYWHQLLKSWIQSLLATFVPLFVVLAGLKLFLPVGLLMSLGYPILTVLVLTPLFLCIRDKSFFEVRYLAFATICVCAAIALRFMDKTSVMDSLPMGSHFLWHTLGALTCHFFIRFNYDNFAKPISNSGADSF